MPEMLRAQYERRGPVPQDVIHAVEFETPQLEAGQELVEVTAAPINPSDVLTLTGEYAQLPPLPAIGGREGVGRIAVLGPVPRVQESGSGSWCCCRAAAVAGRRTSWRRQPSSCRCPTTSPLQLARMTMNPPSAALLLIEFATLDPGAWVIQNATSIAVGMT